MFGLEILRTSVGYAVTNNKACAPDYVNGDRRPGRRVRHWEDRPGTVGCPPLRQDLAREREEYLARINERWYWNWLDA